MDSLWIIQFHLRAGDEFTEANYFFMAMTPREKFMIGGKLHLRCKACQQIKPVEQFYFNLFRQSYNPYCNKCNCVRAKKYQEKARRYRVETEPKYIPPGSPELELFINMTLKELAL